MLSDIEIRCPRIHSDLDKFGGLYRIADPGAPQPTKLASATSRLTADGRGGVLALGFDGVLNRYAPGSSTPARVDTLVVAFALGLDGVLYDWRD